MGVTLAFVCEALERGWLTEREVGVPFGWGDWRGMLRLVEMTASREGFGDRLAEGAWRLAESVHPEATRAVYAVKRLELPAHSARALKGMSIGYATASRGGSHHDTRPTPQYAQGYDRRVAGRQARVRGAEPALHRASTTRSCSAASRRSAASASTSRSPTRAWCRPSPAGT